MPRPRKATVEQRTSRLNLRLTDGEMAQLSAAAAQAGMTPSAYARHRALNARPPQAAPPIINRDAFVELVRVGTNVNQIAHRLNADWGGVRLPSIDAVARQVDDILQRLLADGAARRG